ncbi:MAG: hypothetical protein JW725_02270 [Candidatus Babeliaceae bacterium]|nr:hypothetical protein [Candidatus Babeliaceae bacterium]
MRFLKTLAIWLHIIPPPPLDGESAEFWAEKYYGNTSEKEKNIAKRFIEILSCQVNVSIDYCTPRSRFQRDLKMYDLESVEVILSVEVEFQISIKEKDAKAMVVIDDMIQYLTHTAEPDGSGNVASRRATLSR